MFFMGIEIQMLIKVEENTKNSKLSLVMKK